MDISVKEEPSEVAEEMDAALYDDVMENGVKMETVEVDDSFLTTDEPSCSSRTPGGATMTPRRANTKLMTIDVRRNVQGAVVTKIYSAKAMCSQQGTSGTAATGTPKRFTVVVPRRTPYDGQFRQELRMCTAGSTTLAQANTGTAAEKHTEKEPSRNNTPASDALAPANKSPSRKFYDAGYLSMRDKRSADGTRLFCRCNPKDQMRCPDGLHMVAATDEVLERHRGQSHSTARETHLAAGSQWD
ncbi:hypothetical protein AAVH_10711 [Aphelenchoides avenae]|nr:hypothetical protein AAVH_10711 [Aphelenchus avenae]